MTNGAPRWLFWVGAFLVLWNMFGVYAFISERMMTPADLAALPKDQQLLWSQMPGWGWAGYGVATLGGLAGAFGIVLKKRWATIVTLLSIAGIIVNFLPTFTMSTGVNVWQPQFYALPLFIIVVALLQYALARTANAKGWTT